MSEERGKYNTKVLFYKAFNVQGQISLMAKEYRHSKRACESLEDKMNKSHKYVEELLASYESNIQYFDNQRYFKTFQNYIKVLESVLDFLGEFEKKAMFMRFIQRDSYKSTIFKLLVEVDRSISALKYGLSLRVSSTLTNDNFSTLEDINAEMDSSYDKFDLLKSDIAGSNGRRERLISDIQLAEKGDLDILKAVEIPERRVKEIPGDIARQGRNFTVFKRMYEGKEVAEKVYRASIKDERLLDQIRKQIAILKKLEVCPYIVRFYGIRRKTRSFGLVTEFAALGTLKELIDVKHSLDKNAQASITTGIVEGVAFLHNLDILHKNIKTSSVLINADMSAKLSGFEFSREVSATTEQVVDLGSDRYRWVPPEKLYSMVNSTQKGDVYSVGVTLWSLWARQYPYHHMKDRTKVEDYIKQGGSVELSALSTAIRPVIEMCLHENPERRPSANELINALDLALPKETDRDSINDNSPPPSLFNAGSSGGESRLASSYNFSPHHELDKATRGFAELSISTKLSTITNVVGLVESPREVQGSASGSGRNNAAANKENDFQVSGYVRHGAIGSNNASSPSLSNLSSQPSQPFHSNGTNNVTKPLFTKDISPVSQPPLLQPQPPFLPWLNPSVNPPSQASTFGSPSPSLPETTQGANPSFNETMMEQNDLEDFADLTSLMEPVTIKDAIGAHNEGRYQEAFTMFQQLNLENEPSSYYFLGYYYFWGQPDVVVKDTETAVRYLKQAVTFNDSDAMDLLGVVYREPDYAGKDLTLAVHWFQQAANLNNRKGFYHLFTAYAAGRGVAKDPAKAKFNLIKAAQLGYPSAIQQANRLKISY